MIGIFGGAPSAPAPYIPPLPAAPPPPPSMADKAVSDAAKSAQDQAKAAAGFSSTIKTSGQGVLEPATLQHKTLLGG